MSRVNLYLVANGETVRVAGARGDTEIECELKGAHLRVLRKPQQLSTLKGRCRIKGCINLISNYKALERLYCVLKYLVSSMECSIYLTKELKELIY